MKMKTWFISPLFLTLPALTYADDEDGWKLGLGIAYEDSPYRDYKREVTPLPFIAYQKGPLSISPVSIEYELIDTEKDESEEDSASWSFSASTSLQLGFDDRGTSDASIFSGMDKRKDTTKLGLELGLGTPFGQFGLDVSGDATGEHKGVTGEVSYNFPLYFGEKTMMLGNIGLQYQDSNYVDYYYGVSVHEATANRAAYTGDTAKNSFAGYMLQHQINDRWGLMHQMRYTSLDDSIVNSSLTTDKDSYLSGFIAVLYKF